MIAAARSFFLIKALCFLALGASASAQTFTHPRDQIALQLGAIQMGYDLPFALDGSNRQQAVNALVMGRNAMAATATKPALKVQGAVSSPNVDTVEFRDQLYSAVEYVVTSPVAGTIRGVATLENNKRVPIPPTRLVVPPSSWTTPVPFAVEAMSARTSADAQELAVQVDATQTAVSGLTTAVAEIGPEVATISSNTESMSESLGGLLEQFKVVELSGSLVFGDSQTSASFVISNPGFGRLTVSAIQYPLGFSGDWSGGSIGPGGTQTVNVTFAPLVAEAYSGEIVVVSDATSGTRSMAVSGQGSRIVSLSGYLAFGEVAVDEAAARSFTIHNTGTMNLVVSEISYPSGFSGDWSGTVAPGGSQEVEVTFRPTLEQPYSGIVNVTTDATSGSGVLATTGVGASPPFEVLVAVSGGTLPVSSELSGTVVSSFRIGKYEVTWGEWQEVRDWAVANGYSDLAGVGAGSSAEHPVTFVNYYDAKKWCNAKSEKQGLVPVYQVSGATYKTRQTEPTVDGSANGYRLPKEAEWEWAARGGASSQGFVYSGSNDFNAVAWYSSNSGNSTKAVGTKTANELGLHDMSGNVWEACEGFYPDSSTQSQRGGSCRDSAASIYLTVKTRGALNPASRLGNCGFRLARNSG